MKPVQWVWSEIEKKAPRPQWKSQPPSVADLVRMAEDDERHDRAIRDAICDELAAVGANATLRAKDRSEAGISANDLRSAVASRLRYGIFDAMDWHLRELGRAGWDRAECLLPDDVAKDAIRRVLAKLTTGSKGGRPEHPAKAWYAKQGYDRAGRSIKQLQREMEEATGVPPPSPTTIREWAKSGK